MDLSKLSDDELKLAIQLQKKYEIPDDYVTYALQVQQASIKHGLNPDFVLPMVKAESGFNPSAISSKGAIGLMQLMPDTASALKKDPKKIDENIDGGMLLLKQLIANKNIGKDPARVIAGYNANPATPFVKTGDIKDLPNETLVHLNNVAKFSGGELASPYTSEEPPSLTTEEKKKNTIEVSDQDFKENLAKALLDPSTIGGAEIGAGLEVGKTINDIKNKFLAMTPEERAKMTGGEKWSLNWRGQETPGVGGVPEASAKYQRAKGQGKITGRMSKMYGPPKAAGEPDALLDRLAARRAAAEAAEAASTPSLVGRIAQKTMGFPPLTGAVAGALGGYNAMQDLEEAKNRYDMGDNTGAAIAGVGALGSGLSMIPTVPTRVVGTGLAVASPLAMKVYQNMQNQKQMPPATEQEMQQAQQPAFGVYPKAMPANPNNPIDLGTVGGSADQ
jgi:hypothetical protein